MKILALDTSGPNCSVAVIDENKVIANFNLNIGTTHSQILLPLVDELNKFSNLTLNDIDAFACSIGPGSFTGLRIGIATIKGFAISLNKPVISVPSLVGLAYNVPTFNGIVCTVLDAKNDNVYSALFNVNTNPEMIGDYITDTIDCLVDELKKYNKRILFVGDGAVSFKERFENEFGENALFMPHHLNEQTAISIAKAALDKANQNEIDTVDNLHPLYLRKSQAERMLDENAKNCNK
ncbi:tRNA (adenosine(37)-N6)-threonylcarbamoyltransferase complex dimerization subunit type 1 TsaB [bacterium]|nr:tRNA (adenosine(37)-N6)-threonylcarbamoyltransferase complex dimerization subunit type 1 TsaB [bacterium]